MSETQKSIFITGAASGLGREVARYFANVGWFVGLADVNERASTKPRLYCQPANGRATALM
jgi:NAD(P)-dependent dehydrogenase (short-subunit alcohol dehydrogenase family)